MSEREYDPKQLKSWLKSDWNQTSKLARDMLDYITQLEASLAEAKADSKRLDKLEKALATDQIVSVECGYYDHDSGEGGFFLCPLSGSQVCGHSIREAIDKLETYET